MRPISGISPLELKVHSNPKFRLKPRGRAGAGKGDSMRRAIGLRVWFLSILLMGGAIASRAQDAASVTGVVSDPTGAVLVGADVTLENPNSKIVFHAKTNSV